MTVNLIVPRFLVAHACGSNMEQDVMTYITSVEVTYQTECEDNPEDLCDKVWTKEYDPAVTKVHMRSTEILLFTIF